VVRVRGGLKMRGPRTPSDRRKREVALFLVHVTVCSWDGSPGCYWCCERPWIFLLNSRGYTRCTSHQFEADRRQTPNAKGSRKKMQSPAHDFGAKLMGKFTHLLSRSTNGKDRSTGIHKSQRSRLPIFSRITTHTNSLPRMSPFPSCILPC